MSILLHFRCSAERQGPDDQKYMDTNYDNTRYNVGRNTKEMVSKILKAAEDGDDNVLNTLLD